MKSRDERKRKSDTAGSVTCSKKKRRKASNAGRPNSLDGERLGELLQAYYERPYSLRQLGDMFGVSRMTVWRAVTSYAPPPEMLVRL